VRKVGEGGMGEVYAADHVFIKKRLAIKLLRADVNVSEDAEERLYREANATSSIGHPNIVKIEDFGHAADGAVYLAMEWLDGITLEDLMKKGQVEFHVAVDLMAQTCAGLAAAHREGVVHRDMKPANIILLHDGHGAYTVKLVDFGIAKLMYSSSDALTDKGTFVGTPHFVSPEQALGEMVDHRSDLYAVGVMLYELVVGKLPFDNDGFIDVLQQHVSRAPVPPAKRANRVVPAALNDVILRCLEKDPKRRFTNATELQLALEAISEELAPTSASSSASTSAAASGSSVDAPARATMWPYLVLIVLLLAGGAALFHWQQSGDTEPKAVAPVVDAGVAANTADARSVVVVAKSDAALPPPSQTEWQYRGRGKHFSFRAAMSPSPVAPGEQLSLMLTLFEPSKALAVELAKGPATITVELIQAKRQKTITTAQRRLLDTGKMSSPVLAKLPKQGAYQVVLRLARGGRWLARAEFKLCVGADPAGDAALYRRICGQ